MGEELDLQRARNYPRVSECLRRLRSNLPGVELRGKRLALSGFLPATIPPIPPHALPAAVAAAVNIFATHPPT